MQGKSRSIKTDDLAYIFFKIRETRCAKTRRSWQRRARLALAKREDLTPEERHEICCVWSKSNVGSIDSPAMSKYFKREHRPQPQQTISARSCTRRRFDAPIEHRCNVDRTNPFAGSDLRHLANCMLYRGAFLFERILFQGYIYQRCDRGSGEPDFLSDSRVRQHRHHARTPDLMKPPQKLKKQLFSMSAFKTFQKHSARNEL